MVCVCARVHERVRVHVRVRDACVRAFYCPFYCICVKEGGSSLGVEYAVEY